MDLTLRRGELLTLLGPSGCGKTTVLRIVAGFETPDAGTVHVGGRDVTELPPYRRSVHTVFQHYALFPHMTVRQNLAFGLRYAGLRGEAARARIEKVVDLLQLEGKEDRAPRQLSGGEQQRVALGRALVLEPEVLLLDEPFAALDAALRREMQRELKLLQARVRTAFLFVTHDREEAIRLGDRMAVMRGGRLQQMGTPRDLYERPRTAWVAGFLGASNFFEGALERDGTRGWRLKTDEGLAIPLGRGGAGRTGTRASLALRPERISVSITRPQGTGLALFRGKILEATFLGDRTLRSVQVEGRALPLTASGRGDGALAPGDRVWVVWPEEATVRLETEPEAGGGKG